MPAPGSLILIGSSSRDVADVEEGPRGGNHNRHHLQMPPEHAIGGYGSGYLLRRRSQQGRLVRGLLAWLGTGLHVGADVGAAFLQRVVVVAGRGVVAVGAAGAAAAVPLTQAAQDAVEHVVPADTVGWSGVGCFVRAEPC